MPNEQLVAHIRGEFAQGVDRAAVIRSLLEVGWKDEDIQEAMTAVSGITHSLPPVPPMAPPASHSTTPSYQAGSTRVFIQNGASAIFIGCVALLAFISVMGVWRLFEDEVVVKSFETLVLLSIVAAVVLAASRFVGNPSAEAESTPPNPLFRTMRNATLAVLIASSALLAFLGVLTIWEVIDSSSVLEKALSTLGIIAFAALIIVMVCLEREQNPFWRRHKKGLSWGSVVGFLVLIWVIAIFLGGLF